MTMSPKAVSFTPLHRIQSGSNIIVSTGKKIFTLCKNPEDGILSEGELRRMIKSGGKELNLMLVVECKATT